MAARIGVGFSKDSLLRREHLRLPTIKAEFHDEIKTLKEIIASDFPYCFDCCQPKSPVRLNSKLYCVAIW